MVSSRAIRGVGMVALLGVFLASCGDAPVAPPTVATIQVTLAADTLRALGATVQLDAVARDASGNPIAGKVFTWSSSALEVATVSDAGLATAIGNGATTITAATDGVAGSTPLSVAQVIDGVVMTPQTATLETVGATLQFTAVAHDANGHEVAGAGFLWLSSNPSVAAVDTTGLVTSLGTGQTTITAVVREIAAHAALTVTQTAAKLAFWVEPTNAVAGATMSRAVQVVIQDTNGNRVSNASHAITVAFGANPGGGTLSGTKTVNAVNGVASFSGLSAGEKAGTGCTLIATADGLTGATSATFDITAAAATQLAFTGEPSTSNNGVSISPAVEVSVRDAFGNTVLNATDAVTVVIGTNPGGGTLSGTATIGAVGGVATFSDLSIDVPANGYTLVATSNTLSGTTSAAFNVLRELTFGSVSAGTNHSCGVANGGGVYCWGGNSRGQLGDGTTIQRLAPVAVPSDSFYFSVSAGAEYTCGIAGNTAGRRLGVRTAQCWGANDNDQLGFEHTGDALQPFVVHAGQQGSFTRGLGDSISAGSSHTCLLRFRRITGVVIRMAYCWGSNELGQLGDGTTTQRLTSSVIIGKNKELRWIDVGSTHTCGTIALQHWSIPVAGAAFCWGSNEYGQLGDGTTTDRLSAALVSGGHSFISIAAGSSHTCAINTESAVYCWGSNQFGQLGDGTTIDRLEPVLASGGHSFLSISARSNHTCGITSDLQPYCWGLNESGQLGDGTTADRHEPVLVSGGLSFVTIDAGSTHTCGTREPASLSTNGVAYCWGSNEYGQLGDGTTTDRLSPARLCGVSVTGGAASASVGAGGGEIGGR